MEASIDELFKRITSLCRERLVMIYCQLSSCLMFRCTTVAATELKKIAKGLVLWVRHVLFIILF